MKSRTKKVLAGIAIIAGIVGVGVWNASQSSASPSAVASAVKPDCDHPPTTWPLCPRSVGNPQLVDKAVTENKLSDAVKAKLNAVGTGQQGPKGDKGDKGDSAIVTITADTMVTNRPDTGVDGTVWAKDNMTRTLSLTKQSAAEASKCGSGAVRCFFYTGTIKDAGTFTTIDGAHSPNAPATPVAGANTGTVNGVYAIEFYASTDEVNPSLVDATISGGSPSTSDWMKLAFPAGTHFSALGGIDYTWQYNLASTCETHTQTTAANTGNITGVSHCS